MKNELLVSTNISANANNQKGPGVLFPYASPDPFKGGDKTLQLVPLRALCFSVLALFPSWDEDAPGTHQVSCARYFSKWAFFFFLLEQLWDISMYKIILFSSYFGKEKFLI